MVYDVTIDRLEISALFDLKGPADRLAVWAAAALPPFPERPNTVTHRDARTLIWTGRDRWLLRAPLDHEETLLAVLRPEDAPPEIGIVLVSDTLAFFAITGPGAQDVMAVASPLDLHPRAFPEDGATFSEAFGLRALFLRRAGGFELAVDRSFAAMVAEYLERITA